MSEHDFGSFGRFELYSITIEKLKGNRQTDLQTITYEYSDKNETIYKRDDEEEIPVGKPLSLTGLSRPWSPYDPLYIVFGDSKKSNWKWHVIYDEAKKASLINQPVKEHVLDPETNSCALVCYDLMSKAVDAELSLKYFDKIEAICKGKEEKRAIRIIEGEIYATTAGHPHTKRVLRSFGGSETSLVKRKSRWYPKNCEEEEVWPREKISLDRSMLGLPVGSDLQVTFNLKYYLVPFGRPENYVCGMIFMTHSFPVPDSPKTSDWDFIDTETGIKLNLKVTWSDDLYSNMVPPLEITHPVRPLVPLVLSYQAGITELNHLLRKRLEVVPFATAKIEQIIAELKEADGKTEQVKTALLKGADWRQAGFQSISDGIKDLFLGM